jgi:hypothetical protein
MAPELCLKLRNPDHMGYLVYNEKLDVYSFAIVLWEMITLQCVWTDLTALGLRSNSGNKRRDAVLQAVEQGRRPPPPGNHGPELQALVERCWKPHPDNRPSFTDILVHCSYKCSLCLLCPGETTFCTGQPTSANDPED